jgi:hypothetical protein
MPLGLASNEGLARSFADAALLTCLASPKRNEAQTWPWERERFDLILVRSASWHRGASCVALCTRSTAGELPAKRRAARYRRCQVVWCSLGLSQRRCSPLGPEQHLTPGTGKLGKHWFPWPRSGAIASRSGLRILGGGRGNAGHDQRAVQGVVSWFCCGLTFVVRRDRRYCALPARCIMYHRRRAGKVQCRWASPRPRG